MAYRHTKTQRTKNKNRLGVLLISIIICIVLSLIYFGYQYKQNRVVLNPETLCPETGSPEYMALIFDKTDSYNTVQKQFLKRFFEKFKLNLKAGTQISLYVIDNRSRKEIEPDFTICSPRMGEQASELYENPVQIRQRWKERFEKPLDDAIDGFMQSGETKYSPIMEVIQAVSLSAFPLNVDHSGKKIIIISDMLHHTDEWSNYQGQMDFEALKKTAYYQRVNTDIQGAEVEILYVRRDKMEKIQTKRHAFFWADYISSIGGKVTLIEKIDG